ncbi:MAG: hypothetical protein ACLQU9_10475 [Acidimicrobiales bacterium]
MSKSVLYMSMSLDGYIAGPNDQPSNPGGDDFMRLHEWYGFAADAGPSEETIDSAGTMPSSKVGCTVTASSSRDSKKIDTIYPWTAWAHQALGGAIAVAMIMVELVANPDDFFWPVAAAVGALYILVTIALCLRPPGVELFDDEILVRQFGHGLRIDRTHVQEPMLVRSQRVVGGDSPSTSRHLRLVVSINGVERDIPAVWCDSLLGRLTAHEAEVAESKIRQWMVAAE